VQSPEFKLRPPKKRKKERKEKKKIFGRSRDMPEDPQLLARVLVLFRRIMGCTVCILVLSKWGWHVQ
jgi:hypothetical protein